MAVEVLGKDLKAAAAATAADNGMFLRLLKRAVEMAQASIQSPLPAARTEKLILAEAVVEFQDMPLRSIVDQEVQEL